MPKTCFKVFCEVCQLLLYPKIKIWKKTCKYRLKSARSFWKGLLIFLHMWLNLWKKTSRARIVHRTEVCFFFFFFLQQQSMMKWTGWFPHPQILDLQFRITHGLAPVIRMTYFLLSGGWSGGYDLILLLLMEPKRKANSRAAVGWQTFFFFF